MFDLEAKIKERTEQIGKIKASIEQLQPKIIEAQAQLQTFIETGKSVAARLDELINLKKEDGNGNNGEVPGPAKNN